VTFGGRGGGGSSWLELLWWSIAMMRWLVAREEEVQMVGGMCPLGRILM